MRKHSRPRWDRTVPLKLGTLTTVDNAHNTADTKYSVYHVAKITVKSKDRRGRQHSKWIDLPRKKQICICVNKMDCYTAYSKQLKFRRDLERDEERVEQDDEWKKHPQPAEKWWKMVRMTSNGDD